MAVCGAGKSRLSLYGDLKVAATWRRMQCVSTIVGDLPLATRSDCEDVIGS